MLGKHARKPHFFNKRKRVLKSGKWYILGHLLPDENRIFKRIAYYFLLFKNERTEFQKVYSLRHKSEFPDKFKKYKALSIKPTGNRKRTLQTDNRKEYLSKDFRTSYEQERYCPRDVTLTPYVPQRTGWTRVAYSCRERPIDIDCEDYI